MSRRRRLFFVEQVIPRNSVKFMLIAKALQQLDREQLVGYRHILAGRQPDKAKLKQQPEEQLLHQPNMKMLRELQKELLLRIAQQRLGNTANSLVQTHKIGYKLGSRHKPRPWLQSRIPFNEVHESAARAKGRNKLEQPLAVEPTAGSEQTPKEVNQIAYVTDTAQLADTGIRERAACPERCFRSTTTQPLAEEKESEPALPAELLEQTDLHVQLDYLLPGLLQADAVEPAFGGLDTGMLTDEQQLPITDDMKYNMLSMEEKFQHNSAELLQQNSRSDQFVSCFDMSVDTDFSQLREQQQCLKPVLEHGNEIMDFIWPKHTSLSLCNTDDNDSDGDIDPHAFEDVQDVDAALFGLDQFRTNESVQSQKPAVENSRFGNVFKLLLVLAVGTLIGNLLRASDLIPLAN